MDRRGFLSLFPEFRDIDARLIDAKLAEAAASMGGPDTSVWGSFAPTSPAPAPCPAPTLADVAHANLAADFLWTSPGGAPFALDPKTLGQTSPYALRFQTLLESVAGGGLVAGGPTLATGGGGAPPPALIFTAGLGTASVTNGSTAVTFTAPVSLQAGTVLVFPMQQPGALYSLAATVLGGTSATLMAPYTGVSASGVAWTHT